uniref:Uncharacterized protein n=1 Tax=Romanomermis culicivorax TaxID=13658 RepID=A0A915J4I7_ROMCU
MKHYIKRNRACKKVTRKNDLDKAAKRKNEQISTTKKARQKESSKSIEKEKNKDKDIKSKNKPSSEKKKSWDFCRRQSPIVADIVGISSATVPSFINSENRNEEEQVQVGYTKDI